MTLYALWSIRPPRCVTSFLVLKRYRQKHVARLYWQFIGRLHGIPSVLISDRDVRFTSKFWKELWRLLGTNLRMGSGFHPESSGQVEIFNKLLEQTLRCTIHQLGETRNWVEVLPSIEFAVNNTPNRTTGYSAFYLNYGFHPLHPLQLLHSPEETRNGSRCSIYLKDAEGFLGSRTTITSSTPTDDAADR